MNIHPDDKALQDYALQQYGEAHPHIGHCHQCHEKVVQYRQMFTALHNSPIPAADSRVVEAVMARLPAPRKAKRSAMPVIAGALSALICLAFLIYFFDWWQQLNGMISALLAVSAAMLCVFLSVTLLISYRNTIRTIENATVS